MQLAVEDASAADAVTLDQILAVHQVLFAASSRSDIAGQIRTSQNWIGGNDYNPCCAAFVPPPPKEIDALLDDLCAFCNDDSLPPIAQAAIAHAQFETIHPFIDGNGRTGRALVQVLVRRRQLAPAYVPPAAWAIIDVLPGYPVITVAVAVAATGRTKPAVNQAVAQLVAAGVLVALGDDRRNRAWDRRG
jgi:hypothetical protein